jgi:site-specific DNA recombinase
MLRAAIYARYSSDNQRDESIDAQVRLCKEHIRREGYILTEIYADEAVTGTTDDRAQFQQMMSDAKEGMFDVVVVDAVDRFSRDKYDSALYKRDLRKKYEIKIEYASQRIDDSPEGQMMEGMLESVAQYHSANLARETMKGLTENALRGWHTGGIPPFGLKLVPHTIIGKKGKPTTVKLYDIHPDQAPVVKKIFEIFDAGGTYGDIYEATKDDMIRLRGRPLAKNSIHDMLRNEKYTGTFVYGKGTKKKHRKGGKNITRVPDAFPAIISREMWERIQARMDKRRRSPGERARGKAKEVYLLSGLIYCGYCGSAFSGNRSVGKTDKKRYAYYMCGLRKRSKECDAKTIRKEVVEKIVVDDIKRGVFAPKAKAGLRKKFEKYLQARPQSLDKRITQIRKEVAGIDKIINNLVAAIELGKGSATLIERLELQEDRKGELQNELLNLEAKKEQPVEIGLVDELLEKAEKEFEKADDLQKVKQVIQLFVDRVVVHDDKVEVITKIKIPAGESDNDGDSGGTLLDTMGSPKGDWIVTQKEYKRPKRVTGL